MSFFSSIILLILLLIFDRAGSSLLRGLLCNCIAQAAPCSGFSCCGARALEHVGCSSHGRWAYWLLGMWDPPRSGIQQASPASAGGFFTSEPPGKPKNVSLFILFFFKFSSILFYFFQFFFCLFYF